MEKEQITSMFYQANIAYLTEEYDKALNLLTQCANEGFIPAFVLIGDCYRNGYGVAADAATAVKHYNYAANAGDVDGLLRMGDVYLQCEEPEKAIECFIKASDSGSEDAIFNIASIYYNGCCSISRDLSTAAKYFEKYVGLIPDDAEALHLLGRCYLFMENGDSSKASELFEKAASLGNVRAAKDLSALELGGQIVN